MVLDAAPGCVTLLPGSGDRRVRLHRQPVAAEALPAIADRRALSHRPRRVHPAGLGAAGRDSLTADLGGDRAGHRGRVPDPATKGERELRATRRPPSGMIPMARRRATRGRPQWHLGDLRLILALEIGAEPSESPDPAAARPSLLAWPPTNVRGFSCLAGGLAPPVKGIDGSL